MKSLRCRSWLAALIIGYLLLHLVFVAEIAYSLPRGLNTGCSGLLALWFLASLKLRPVRWFAAGPCQHYPHLSLEIFLPAVLLLGLGYLGALRAVQRRPEAWSFRRLLGLAALAALPLATLLPPTTVDYLSYFFAGRVLAVHHLSPWHHTLGQLSSEHNYVSPAIWGADLKCIYGPVWVGLMAVLAEVGQCLAPGAMTGGSFLLSLLLLRAANGAALVAAAAAVWRINGLMWPRQQRLVTAAFLLNPLMVYEAVGALHNDVWGVAFLLWACYWFLKNETRFLAPLALSFLTKYAVFVMVPFLGIYAFRQRDWRRLGGLAAVVVLCAALTALTSTEYLTTRLAASAKVWYSSTSLTQFVAVLIGWSQGSLHDIPDLVRTAAQVAMAMFLPIFAWLVWRTRTREQVITHCLWALLLYLVAVFMQTMEWYYLWPLGLLCAMRWTPAIANAAWASCAVLLGYGMYFWMHNGADVPSLLASFLLAIALPAIVCLAGRRGWWQVCALPAEGEKLGSTVPPGKRRRASQRDVAAPTG